MGLDRKTWIEIVGNDTLVHHIDHSCRVFYDQKNTYADVDEF